MIIEYIRPCPLPTPTTMIIGPVPKVISFSQLSFKIAIIALQKIDDIQTMTCDVTLDKPRGAIRNYKLPALLEISKDTDLAFFTAASKYSPHFSRLGIIGVKVRTAE